MISRVSALVAAIGLLAMAASSHAQTVRVESEDFDPPAGNATTGTGPNASKVVGIDAILAVSPPASPKKIGYFDMWDWLEYNVTIPSDGLYSVTYRYASDWQATVGYIPQVLSFYTSGQQIIPTDVVYTKVGSESGWNNFVVYTLQNTVPLKAGANRFRLQIRPDMENNGSMNMDYIEFTRVGDYPALQPVSGTVTTNINDVATPLAGALVYVGDNTSAQYLTRTDASGNYTLYLPSGTQSVTAFANGFARSSAPVSAPAEHNFSLVWNGQYEAELMDATNPGPGNSTGAQAQYLTALTTASQPRSNFGQVAFLGAGKYVDWKNVVVPADGVYDLSMFYASGSSNNGRLKWQANGGPTAVMTYTPTADSDTYTNSVKTLIELKKGANKIHMVDPDPTGTAYANIDSFTLAPTTQQYGRLTITVKTVSGGTPVAFAAVTLAGTNTGASVTGATDATGTFTVPLIPDTYSITVSKGGNPPINDSADIAANATVTRAYTMDITSLSVEAEDFVASGPDVPGPAADVVSMGGASGGKVIENLNGRGNTDLGYCNYKWAEWVVTVPAGQAGMYQVGLRYATNMPSGENSLNVWSTSAQLHTYGVPTTSGPSDYTDYVYDGTVPLKEGDNRVRITVVNGGLNLDYLTFQRTDSLPALSTFTGTVTGSDGTGSAPVANAYVYAPVSGVLTDAPWVTMTDAAGKYTLTVPAGYWNLTASANGYLSGEKTIVLAPSQQNFTLSINNPDAATPKAERVDFGSYDNVTQFVMGKGTGKLCTAFQELNFVEPGPDTWIEMLVSVPRTGAYTIAANLGSNWPPADQPGHLTVTVNGAAQTVPFQKTGDYATHVTVPLLSNATLLAGRNTVRVAFPDAAANVTYFDFIRTGDVVLPPSTDIDGSGKTDVLDAVLYMRRLSGLDAGPKPDLTGDSASNAQDVIRILNVAGGLA